ncbi:hypothetical protein [Lentzea sp. CA-135723]|uniref:hypothetical protein n=1 Tax=Lentzea sp. CA-135723 TaxID=3239950 RepID=UPI003D90707A
MGAKKANQRSKKRKKPSTGDRAVSLYHLTTIEEDFSRSAQRLLEIAQFAQRESPGARRLLHIDIDGHRNSAGGFDRDAYELISTSAPSTRSRSVTTCRARWSSSPTRRTASTPPL